MKFALECKVNLQLRERWNIKQSRELDSAAGDLSFFYFTGFQPFLKNYWELGGLRSGWWVWPHSESENFYLRHLMVTAKLGGESVAVASADKELERAKLLSTQIVWGSLCAINYSQELPKFLLMSPPEIKSDSSTLLPSLTKCCVCLVCWGHDQELGWGCCWLGGQPEGQSWEAGAWQKPRAGSPTGSNRIRVSYGHKEALD